MKKRFTPEYHFYRIAPKRDGIFRYKIPKRVPNPSAVHALKNRRKTIKNRMSRKEHLELLDLLEKEGRLNEMFIEVDDIT